MWTYRKSQKAMNLLRDARCALLVEEGVEYFRLKGVLVRGQIEILEEVEAVAEIGRRLYERYTGPRTGLPFEGAPQAEVLRQAPKRVGLMLPAGAQRVTSWDHSKLERSAANPTMPGGRDHA